MRASSYLLAAAGLALGGWMLYRKLRPAQQPAPRVREERGVVASFEDVDDVEIQVDAAPHDDLESLGAGYGAYNHFGEPDPDSEEWLEDIQISVIETGDLR
jgi:hypothetical protein